MRPSESRRNRGKGLSPLIGAVLLIAFTMAVAAILTAWVTTFTEQRTQQLGNQSDQVIRCSYAGIDISEANFDSGNSQTYVTVRNSGTVDLNNISVTSFLEAGVQSRAFLADLGAGDTESVTLRDTDVKPDSVRATSKTCPGVSALEDDVGTL